jgi:hypothetical protein
MDAGGNAPTVIRHGDRPVGIQRDLNMCTVSSERLVNGVVYYLIDEVM